MKILIAEEKHGDRYFDASTVEALHAACVKLLKERLEEGWYYVGDEPVVETVDIETIPKSMQEDVKKKLASQKREHARWGENNEFVKAVKAIIAAEEIKTFRGRPESYYVLSHRNYGEYENISLQELEAISGEK